MPLIVAIEPDRRQASQVTAIARRLHAELVIADATDRAFELLGPRVPDLILTAALLPPKDENALADRLRELDAHASHVQTLTIPVFATSRASHVADGVLTRLRRKSKAATLVGCDPGVFAEQIVDYLQRAAAEREALAGAEEETTVEIPLQPTDDFAMPSSDEASYEEPPAPAAPVADLTIAELEESLRNIVLEESLAQDAAVEETDVTLSAIDPDAGEWTNVDLNNCEADVAEEPTHVEEQPSSEDRSPAEHVVTPDAQGFVESEWAAMEAAAAEPTESEEPTTAEPATADVPTGDVRVSETPVLQPLVYQSARWMEALEALRREVEQQGSASVASASPPAESEQAADASTSMDADADAHASAAAIAARKARRANEPSPIQDEWGFFDPEQCGFAALLQKLDEITDKNGVKVKRPA